MFVALEFNDVVVDVNVFGSVRTIPLAARSMDGKEECVVQICNTRWSKTIRFPLRSRGEEPLTSNDSEKA